MKRKIVIKVQMSCGKCRSKALKIAVEVDGVNNVEIKGEEKDQLVVTGDDVDSVKLTQKLRKELGFATISSVEEEKEKEEETSSTPTPIQWYDNRWRPPGYEMLVYEPKSKSYCLLHHVIFTFNN